MSILRRVPEKEKRERYTHVGWFAFCPIYYGGDSDAPTIAERNWVPEWRLDAAEAFQGLSMWALSALRPDYEPQYMMVLTGEIR